MKNLPTAIRAVVMKRKRPAQFSPFAHKGLRDSDYRQGAEKKHSKASFEKTVFLRGRVR